MDGATVLHRALILLAGGFGILVLLIFITGLGVVSRASLLFREVSTINTEFRQLSLDLERLRSDMFLVGSYVRDQLGLRPSMLDDSGIVPAVRWQASELSRRTGTPVELQIEGDFDGLGDEGRTCLYRVVQEALTNCARHAEATTIQITMQSKKESLCLSIRDDGLGFDTGRARTGLGLIGIEERVKELGGSLAVRSWPDRGTLLRVEIPLANSNS